MIVLDTKVVSELMLDAPNPNVLAWVDGIPALELFVTAVTEAEIRTCIAFLPDGARRAASRTLPSACSAACSPAGFCRSTATRRARMRISPRTVVLPGARSERPIARSQRSPVPAAWLWRRATFAIFPKPASRRSTRGRVADPAPPAPCTISLLPSLRRLFQQDAGVGGPAHGFARAGVDVCAMRVSRIAVQRREGPRSRGRRGRSPLPCRRFPPAERPVSPGPPGRPPRDRKS